MCVCIGFVVTICVTLNVPSMHVWGVSVAHLSLSLSLSRLLACLGDCTFVCACVFVSAGALAFAFVFAFALALTASWAFQKRIVKTRCPGRSRKLSGRVPGSSWFLVRGFLQTSYIYIYVYIYIYILIYIYIYIYIHRHT